MKCEVCRKRPATAVMRYTYTVPDDCPDLLVCDECATFIQEREGDCMARFDLADNNK